MDLQPEIVKEMLDKNDHEYVLQHDQLKVQRDCKKVFVDYKEGPITHPPTYKYDPGTDNWDSSEKNRCPAWCDRILWRGDGIELLSYRSHPELKLSDHKPVSGLFRSSMKVINMEKRSMVYKDVMRKLDKLENEFSPQVAVDKSELNFGTVTFRQRATQSLTIANTGQVPLAFEFTAKDYKPYKEWLTISPFTSNIHPGEKMDIEFVINVDMDHAMKFNTGSDEIYEILVIHLNSKKALFIIVSGTYKPSCFGSSIDTLIRLKTCVDDMKIDEFQRLSRKENLAEYPVCWGIPKEVWFLVDFLFKRGLMQESLFQMSGRQIEFEKIRECLDSGCAEEPSCSIHSVAEALLVFLESLQEPLIPYQFYQRALENYHNFLLCKEVYCNTILLVHTN